MIADMYATASNTTLAKAAAEMEMNRADDILSQLKLS